MRRWPEGPQDVTRFRLVEREIAGTYDLFEAEGQRASDVGFSQGLRIIHNQVVQASVRQPFSITLVEQDGRAIDVTSSLAAP